MSNNQQKKKTPKSLWTNLAGIWVSILWLAALLAGIVMLGFIAIAFWEVFTGLRLYWIGTIDGGSDPTHHLDHSSIALKLAITGLEFLFLAPLYYMVILSFARYFWTQGGCSELHEDDAQRPDQERRTHAEMLHVKAASVGLLLAIMATIMIKRMQSDIFESQSSWVELVAMGVLASYSLGLEYFATKLNRH